MSIYLRGDIWHIYIARGGKRVRASLRTKDYEEAKRREATMEAEIPREQPEAAWVFTEDWVNKRLWAMRQRSKRHTDPCMSRDDLRALITRARGRCELTGIPFSEAHPIGCKRAPFAPSVDRIDARRGYSVLNCRLVCFAVNVALNQWGDETTRRIALGLISPEFVYSPRHTEIVTI